MQTVKTHLIIKVARVTLGIAFWVVLAHLFLPHHHGSIIYHSKELCTHPEAKGVIHFFMDLLLTDAGPNHLENFQESKVDKILAAFLPATLLKANILRYHSASLPLQCQHFESQFDQYNHPKRGPPCIA